MSKLVGAITGTTSAAKKAAERTREAADMAKFRPWDVSGSYFGDASFDPNSNTASYNLSPELTQLRDMFMGEAFDIGGDASTARTDADAMRGYGRDLFSEASGRDVTGVGNKYYTDVMNLMAPGRAGQQQQLAQNLFSSGRSGAAMAAPEGGGYVNPERMEYLTAMNRDNSQIAYDSLGRARQEQQQDMDRGIGMYGLADTIRSQPYNQMNSMFGLGAGIEQMGQQPMNQGIALGSAAQPGNQAMSQGYMNASNQRLNADLGNSAMFMNLLAQGAGAYTGGNPFASSAATAPRQIGAGGVGGYGQGMFSNWNVG
tara:strand:+ start:95 stop:1036 length:942 start_codon:yes stop_codon:yes gene_type:complete